MWRPLACAASSSSSRCFARSSPRGYSGRRLFFRGQTKKCGSNFRGMSTIPPWATFDPYDDNKKPADAVYEVSNLVDGTWTKAGSNRAIPNPLDRDAPPIFAVPDTRADELSPFLESLRKVSKSGMHNPLKNPERYVQYGEITRKAGNELMQPEVADFFAKCITRCVPKSHAQALGEVMVTASFLNNFGGDNVRRLAKSFGVSGDHYGQMSVGHRWPYGPVALVTPFNFPLEIPVLQLMGALFMGNKPVLKPSEQVSVVMEQYLKLLHHCGTDAADVDFLVCRGPVAEQLIAGGSSPVRMTQFTGSSRVGERLARATNGKVKLEDAGFDWKILGPDVGDVDYVAWQCDQDAYASLGQKCSAQSICFIHENWRDTGLLDKMKENAERRTVDDLTIGPTLTVTTQQLADHTERLLQSVPGASVLWGGKEIEQHNFPPQYGAFVPTAVCVPLEEMMAKDDDSGRFELCTTELFAPFQVISFYDDDTLDLVLEALERISHHLTAAVVSNDVGFQTRVLAHTVNGTTYAGRRARTTGAPQNHWFGPAGDPRGCGIGTPEAIQLVWSCHREIIHDTICPPSWTQPKPS